MDFCDRCEQETRITTMSIFNTDTICMKCKAKEREHPQFEAARQAELAACKQGNYNFAGIGKPADL